jgi:predicted transcriptional regulator
MEIKLKVISENPDGSANARVTYDEEGLEFLVQEGTTSIIKQYIAQQKGESNVKDIWEIANEIESLACRVSNLKDIVEMVATAVSTEPESGSLWAVRDHLEILSEKIEVQVQHLMDIYRDQKVKEVEVTSTVKPKSKKKKKEFDIDGRC